MNKFKIQVLNFVFANAGEVKSDSLKIESGYTLVKKMSVRSTNYFQAPAQVESLSIDNDSGTIEAGTFVSHFQDLQSDLELNKKVRDNNATIAATLKDITQGAFTAYSVQIAFYLEKEEA